MKRREKRQPAIEEQQLSINVPTAVVVLIKRIALKAIIAKHQWNSVINICLPEIPPNSYKIFETSARMFEEHWDRCSEMNRAIVA